MSDEENAKNPWWPPESKPVWKPIKEKFKKVGVEVDVADVAPADEKKE